MTRTLIAEAYLDAGGSCSVRGNSGYWNDKANNLIYADDERPRS